MAIVYDGKSFKNNDELVQYMQTRLEEQKAALARITKEKEELASRPVQAQAFGLSVGPSGNVNLKGVGGAKWGGVYFYASQLQTILANADVIRAFIATNIKHLSCKDPATGKPMPPAEPLPNYRPAAKQQQ